MYHSQFAKFFNHTDVVGGQIGLIGGKDGSSMSENTLMVSFYILRSILPFHLVGFSYGS